MSREETTELICKLFAKSMYYGKWQWETPTERVITMLMQDIGLYTFDDEDDMIAKTEVPVELYRLAKDKIK